MENSEKWLQNSNEGMIGPDQMRRIIPNENNRLTGIKRRFDYAERSDDDSSNLSSAYDDHSSNMSSGDLAALRERSNSFRLQKSLGNFVPEVSASGNAVPAPNSETGFFVKGEGGGLLRATNDDELHQQVPVSKYEELELRILRQPEEQHRARYMSEGSRGSVKDRSGKSHVTVSLRGYYRPAVLEIFAAVGSGPVIPHPLYRLIPVTGKNGSSVTACKEGVTADGAACLQVILRPENKMTAVLDCIGILKICSYDLKRKLPKQNRSASVRLVFRVTVAAQDRRQNVTLQTVSLPVVCAQQPGYPDVSRISCTQSSVRGNVDVFIVGKNFSNNATVYLKEYGPDGKIIWQAPATVDQQHIHTCHMICTVPPYRDLYANKCVEAMLTVECGKKVSRPISFKYLPDAPMTQILQGQQQPQLVYDPAYSLDGLGGPTGTGAGGSSTSPNDQNIQQQPSYWASQDFASGITTDDQQRQQFQQLPMLQNPAPAALEQQATPPAIQPAPAVAAATPAAPAMQAQFPPEFSDAKSDSQPPQTFSDEQNASFYFPNQFTDEPPAAKKHCGQDAFSSNTLAFSLDDIPQLFT